MWNIFRRDPLAKTDRRKTRAEKKKRHARQRTWRRRRRAEAWQDFTGRLKELFVQPIREKRQKAGIHEKELATADRRREREERKHIRDREKSWRRRRRDEAMRRFNKRFNEFRAHPFARREPTADALEKKKFKRYARRERRQDLLKWFAKFRKNPWKTLFPPRLHRSPGGGYYTFRLGRAERKEMAAKKRKLFRENLRQAITTPDLRAKFGFAYLHSTAYFILAFMLIYIVYQVITILAASSYNIPIIWSYYKLQFPLYTYSPLYTRQALVVIFAMGPIMSLMLAFVFLKLYFTSNVILKRFKLFYLWGFISGANMFFGAYIAGFITRTEFIYTSEWLFISRPYASVEIVFTIIAIAILIIIGRIVTPLFLLSSGSVTMIKPEFRLFFILSQVIFPWITMMIILFAITLPNYYWPLILKTIIPGLMLIPTLFLYNSIQFDNIHEAGVIQRTYFRWSIVIVAVAVLFFYRVILSYGLRVL